MSTPAQGDGLQCPGCRGRGKVDGLGCPGAKWVSFTCEVCAGKGWISAQQHLHFREGDDHRKARVARRESLREAAERYGCSVVELSQWEHGKGPKPEGVKA